MNLDDFHGSLEIILGLNNLAKNFNIAFYEEFHLKTKKWCPNQAKGVVHDLLHLLEKI